MTRRFGSAWTVYVLAAPLTAGVAMAGWPPSQSLRDEVACDRARGSSPTQTLNCPAAGRPAWAPTVGAAADSRYAIMAHEPEVPVCDIGDDGCQCRVPVGAGTYYVRNHTDWFGGGPDSPGRTGISVSSSWNHRFWWQPKLGGLFGPRVPRPTSIAVAEDTLCVTFGEDSYALDPETLLPTEVAVPTHQRLFLRLGSGPGILFLILALLALPAIVLDYRRRVLERIFGAKGERGSEARGMGAGYIVSNAEFLGAKRIHWHGDEPDADCEVVIVCGPELAREGPAYRSNYRFCASIHAFPGGFAQLLERIASVHRRTNQWGRRVLCGQLAVLTIVFLCLWSG